MVERSLGVREAPGSIPGFSSFISFYGYYTRSFTTFRYFVSIGVLHNISLCFYIHMRITNGNKMTDPECKFLTVEV
jgi:hypothetical protein